MQCIVMYGMEWNEMEWKEWNMEWNVCNVCIYKYDYIMYMCYISSII